MEQRSANLLALAIVVVGGGALLAYAEWPSDDEPAPSSSAAPPAARYLPDPGPHPAPFEAYAGAQPGDWYAYRVENAGPSADIRSTAVAWVSAASPAAVTMAVHGRIDATGEERDGRTEDYPRAGLTLERLTGDDVGGWTIRAVQVTDEPHVVGGRTFACTKLSFASADPMFPTKRTHTELWIAKEVPAGGLVESREVQELDQRRFVITEKLLGFGSASGTAWGERPDGL